MTVRWYAVASTPRTGSTLLCRALWDTGRIGAPKEYLNPVQLRDWEVRLGCPLSRARHLALRGPALALVGTAPWPEARRRAHLARIAERRTGPTGWCGLKVHKHHLDRWLRGDALDDWLPGAAWIRIHREDRLRQAISWVRAQQTGAWAAHRRPWRPAIYRRTAIARTIARIEADERAWDALLAGRKPLVLRYEDLVDDLSGAVEAVLAHLGEAALDGPVRASLQPQADATTEAWVERYRSGR